MLKEWRASAHLFWQRVRDNPVAFRATSQTDGVHFGCTSRERNAFHLKMKSASAVKENSKPSSKPEKAKRIVIVDDHPLFRKGLEQLINSSDDALNVCGEAGDAAEGMSVIRQLKPDLVIVDLS